MTTGIGMPGSMFCVAALKALQNSMMFRPRWPSAGPTGGEGFALPAGTWSLIRPTVFCATGHLLSGSSGHRLRDALPVQSPEAARPVRQWPRLSRLRSRLGLLDLAEIQFHGRRAAENQHRDADLALLVVHFLDGAVEIRERTLGHAHRLAHLEEHLRLGLFHALLHLVQDVFHFL